MAIHHRICHVLGGTFGLAHGDANAVILPHVVAYNRASEPDVMATLADAMGVTDPTIGRSSSLQRWTPHEPGGPGDHRA